MLVQMARNTATRMTKASIINPMAMGWPLMPKQQHVPMVCMPRSRLQGIKQMSCRMAMLSRTALSTHGLSHWHRLQIATTVGCRDSWRQMRLGSVLHRRGRLQISAMSPMMAGPLSGRRPGSSEEKGYNDVDWTCSSFKAWPVMMRCGSRVTAASAAHIVDMHVCLWHVPKMQGTVRLECLRAQAS